MIKAIIFDLGGVLIDNPSPGMIRYFALTLGLPEEAFYDLDLIPLSEFQRGLIPEEAFWKRVGAKPPARNLKSHSLWGEAFKRQYKPKEEMFFLASALKQKGYKIGLLSNIEAPSLEYFNKQRHGIFDAKIFSCEEGVCKPEPKIYEIALARLGVRAKATVFIDDREDFVASAKAMGMETIRFASPGQAREDLARLLGANRTESGRHIGI